ncbi:MAG: acyl-CoA thioesterase [Saprospiraceae bacterium]|nr:acyl-CoA thioesterase [Saprospiraceae bacterium]MCB0623277.1 acyl-CoA thioesterase [Saprospiraceae bacterium]MCB0675079.1 acyl-CoA thioesterase [Saprospiraceae bacterium]MCB0682723.1 acyl-CoA thioesterase [Saprospiraceae bacterium]
MYTHEHQKRVRYGETDQMGYLYYGNYAFYYEIGRVELLRSLGFTYKAMEAEWGIMMPVTSLQMRFVRPARYDELITIRTTLREMPEKYITFHMELYNEAGKLVNGGAVRLCFVEVASNRTVAAPAFLRDALQPFFAGRT